MITEVVRLDSIAEVRLGRQRSPKDHDGPNMRPYVRAANVGWDGWKLDDVKRMNFTDKEMSAYALMPGDLLLGEASGSANEVGKPAIWNGEIKDCAFQNTLIRVRPRTSVVEPRYLLNYFKFLAGTGKFAERSRGVGIHHLGADALASWHVPLPPIEEQRRIAEVLDKAEAVRAKRKTAITEIASLGQAIFVEMFGDCERDSERWPRTTLGDLLSSIESGASPVCHARPAAPDEWGVLKLGAVSWCEYDDTQHKALPAAIPPQRHNEVQQGDVLLARKNTYELVGASAYVEQTRPRLLLSDLIFRLRLRPEAPVRPRYLQQLLITKPKRQQIRSLAGGSAGSMPNVSKVKLATVGIEIPPLPLQVEFERRLVAVRDVSMAMRRTSATMDEIIKSLQHRAFSGAL